MVTITPTVAASLCAECSGTFGTMLVKIAFAPTGGDWSLAYRTPRPGWTSRDVSDNPVLQSAFEYDREFTGLDQTITIYEHPEQDFSVVTAKLFGEPEVECVIVGDSFMLVTRRLLSTGWAQWRDEGLMEVSEEEIRQAVAR